MKRPLATLTALMLVSMMFVGFAASPVAAQETCTSTATATNVGVAGSAVMPSQNSIQVNLANNVQTGAAVSVGGDASVTQYSSIGQTNVADQDQCTQE